MENWLKKQREMLGLNQDALVARLQLEGLNVTRASVSAWETGRNNIPFDEPLKVKIIAKALHLRVYDMLLMAGYPLENEYSHEAMTAATIIDGMRPEYKHMALDVLESIAKNLTYTKIE